MTWINDLDALASAGVLDFDAPAYIKGTQPRYYGNPALETIPSDLPQMKQQPQKDEYVDNSGPVKNPSWKKWLFGGLAAAGLIFGASKIPAIKTWISKINLTTIKDIPSKIWNGIKTGWQYLVNKFKPTQTP